MLSKLERKDIQTLVCHLQNLSSQDKAFLGPHSFDTEKVESLLTNSNHHYYIYLDKYSIVAGYGMLRFWEGFESPTLGCVIWQEYRGKGNGKRLVRELITEAEALGCHTVKLKVHPNNNMAISVYYAVGFQLTNEPPDSLGQIGMSVTVTDGLTKP
jgi:ribosomal protein S18 acetylase RimI-like enzyme